MERDVPGDLARHAPLVGEGRDERDDDDQPGIGHQARRFGDAADVLDAVGFGEAEILVEAMADIVAVEDVAVLALGGQALFEQVGDRRLARTGQAGEPDDLGVLALLARPDLAIDVERLVGRFCAPPQPEIDDAGAERGVGQPVDSG